MSYKTLLAHLALGQPNADLLRLVADIGGKLDARVIGIAACQPMQLLYGDGYVGNGEAIVACQEELEAELRGAEVEFRAALKGHTSPIEWRSSYAIGTLSHFVADQARCADLVLTNVTSVSTLDSSRYVSIGDLIMRTGRPVLVIPQEPAEISFDRIVLAWKDTREARRAALDALPLMALAKHVAVIEIAAEPDVPAALNRVKDVAAWLKLHGIVANPLALPSGKDDAARLEAVLGEQDADLVIAGAYGHSRLREWVFGGVTHSLLEGKRPILFSH